MVLKPLRLLCQDFSQRGLLWSCDRAALEQTVLGLLSKYRGVTRRVAMESILRRVTVHALSPGLQMSRHASALSFCIRSGLGDPTSTTWDIFSD